MRGVIRGRLALDREMMDDEMSVAPVSFPVLFLLVKSSVAF